MPNTTTLSDAKTLSFLPYVAYRYIFVDILVSIFDLLRHLSISGEMQILALFLFSIFEFFASTFTFGAGAEKKCSQQLTA